MTGFDIIVLVIVAICAIGGFLRGFVQEVLSLLALCSSVCAIYYLHTDTTAYIYDSLGSPISSSIIAFAVLLLVPYGAIRAIAHALGRKTRKSVLGPIDRVLGFGFGAIKGVVMVVIAFSLVVLGLDMSWGAAGRPALMTEARSYQFIDAASRAMVQIIAERRTRLTGNEAEE